MCPVSRLKLKSGGTVGSEARLNGHLGGTVGSEARLKGHLGGTVGSEARLKGHLGGTVGSEAHLKGHLGGTPMRRASPAELSNRGGRAGSLDRAPVLVRASSSLVHCAHDLRPASEKAQLAIRPT